MRAHVFINPISELIKRLAAEAKGELSLAVPFISSYAANIFRPEDLAKIKRKRLITRLDECSIHSFELSTLKYLLENGFEIRYDNNIHLKLYLNDFEAIVTSSNLTKGGLEDNFELSVSVNSDNVNTCRAIFDDLWNTSSNVTRRLIEDNWDKYLVLKKRDDLQKSLKKITTTTLQPFGSVSIEKLFDAIVNQKADYRDRDEIVYRANKKREIVRNRILEKFDSTIFYAEKGHKKRYDNLFYDFAYGDEDKLAGTGLREKQFATVFTHQDFNKVIDFMLPERQGLEPWNLRDSMEYMEFCNGIFEFDIRNYSEVIPIRLASYFYPDYFLPIFTLEHLEKICVPLGLNTDAKQNGERLCEYNRFLQEKMKSLPYANHIKAHLAYQLMYAHELFLRLSNGENFKEIRDDYQNIWKQELIDHGFGLLKEIGAIK